MIEALPRVFTSGWASGVNAYAVVALLGLLGRFGVATRCLWRCSAQMCSPSR